jgi:acetyl-CoA synthetase
MSTPTGGIVDPVADDIPGAREIGFSVRRRYNASCILFDNLASGNAERVAVRSPAFTE